MRFLMNDFKVIEADTLDEAVIAYCREYTTASPPINVAIIGANAQYQIKETVERVHDNSGFHDLIINELAAGEPISRYFSPSEVCQLFDMEAEGKIKLLKTSISGRLLVCPPSYVIEGLLLSEFQRLVMKEIDKKFMYGRWFNDYEVEELKELERLKKITLEKVSKDNPYYLAKPYEEEIESVTRCSKFQADLLDELEHCDSIGRNFHVNNHADIEDLSRRKMITINEREGNYFVIMLLKGGRQCID